MQTYRPTPAIYGMTMGRLVWGRLLWSHTPWLPRRLETSGSIYSPATPGLEETYGLGTWCAGCQDSEPLRPSSSHSHNRKPRRYRAIAGTVSHAIRCPLLNRYVLLATGKAILLFLLDKGVRNSELTNLKRRACDVKLGSARVSGKGAKELCVAFGVTCRRALCR